MPPLLGRAESAGRRREGGGLTKTFSNLSNFICRRPRVVLAAWAFAAIALNIFVPQLEKVIARDATPFIPSNAASIRSYYAMDRAFGTGKARAPTFLVLEHRGGLTATDQRYYARLVQRLKADRTHVAEVTDYVAHPELRALLISKYQQAVY